jgi:hypothetical protein
MDEINNLMPQEGQKAILEEQLEQIFIDKLPPFPDNIKDVLAKIAPWGYMIYAFFGIIGLLALFGFGIIGSAASVLGGEVGMGGMILITSIISGISILLMIFSVPSLLKHGRIGWVLVYYGWLVGLINTIVTNTALYLSIGGLIGGIVFTGIVLYLHFQMREKFIG